MRWTYRAWRNRDISMNSLRVSMFGLAFLSLAALTGQAQTPAEKPSAPLQAIAVLHPTAGNKVSGTVTFTEVADGFHVHEFGDCSAPDASSAGAHFNPTNKPHAGPDAPERHVGDMGNVEADASGKAKLEYVDHQISLTNDQQSVIGRSVVVHMKRDDLKSQPAGDSGARVACGVIGRAKSQ